ncbi:MAG TPA: hypothetical protein VES65_04485 [Solirubrobacteraceae bacterium]|nr:hypothetical protein [Solirubrobacteraceae bacterium]
MAPLGAAGVFSAPASAAEGTSCSGDSGAATFSPGLTGKAQVQNIVVHGVLTVCTGTVTEAKYVAHVKTTNPVTCATLKATGETAAGTIVVKWKPKGQGNSIGTLTLPVTEVPGASISGKVEEGPFVALGISGTLESLTPTFTGTGEPCTKTNKLKKATLTGSPVTIS